MKNRRIDKSPLLKRKLASASLIFALTLLFASSAFAVTREDLMPKICDVLGRQNAAASARVSVPQDSDSPDDVYLTREQAFRICLEQMGWDFVLSLYEKLEILPQLSGRSAADSIVSLMSPRPAEALRGAAISDLLTDEDTELLTSWLASCVVGVSLEAHFSDENGTALTIIKRGIGNPDGDDNGAEGALGNQPFFAAVLTYDLKKIPTKIAMAQSSFGEKDTELSRYASETYAVIAAVNGGYFGGGSPIGFLRREGIAESSKVWKNRSGIAWNGGGELFFADAARGEHESALRDIKYSEAFQAGPMLLKDGAVLDNTEDVAPKILENRHPRTIAGTRGNNIVWAVVDGRNRMHSVGLTIEETREFAARLGLRDALNLDGGGSSSLWWHGFTVTLPCNSGNLERPLPYAILMFDSNLENEPTI